MTARKDVDAEIGYLIWCFTEGYGLAEDREVLGGNWLLEDDSALHEDDIKTKAQLLAIAADVRAALEPSVGGVGFRDSGTVAVAAASRRGAISDMRELVEQMRDQLQAEHDKASREKQWTYATVCAIQKEQMDRVLALFDEKKEEQP